MDAWLQQAPDSGGCWQPSMDAWGSSVWLCASPTSYLFHSVPLVASYILWLSEVESLLSPHAVRVHKHACPAGGASRRLYSNECMSCTHVVYWPPCTAYLECNSVSPIAASCGTAELQPRMHFCLLVLCRYDVIVALDSKVQDAVMQLGGSAWQEYYSRKVCKLSDFSDYTDEDILRKGGSALLEPKLSMYIQQDLQAARNVVDIARPSLQKGAPECLTSKLSTPAACFILFICWLPVHFATLLNS